MSDADEETPTKGPWILVKSHTNDCDYVHMKTDKGGHNIAVFRRVVDAQFVLDAIAKASGDNS